MYTSQSSVISGWTVYWLDWVHMGKASFS